ncbi:predicted protein [Plenodomus lingam JN3]|uniref:Predicted protein n=1 Tax=Leptosphaeria maculans (strain JN3 / isolate v23.1.3 / race Av1-4-5-6-7-8) TaxID=985895 RepID=E4ZJ53_LEPMJ|nr:predicted protein [Plenodomus lingam JN3]CBX91484.1 predicted protein [Plenodomus lingam JN3]
MQKAEQGRNKDIARLTFPADSGPLFTRKHEIHARPDARRWPIALRNDAGPSWKRWIHAWPWSGAQPKPLEGQRGLLVACALCTLACEMAGGCGGASRVVTLLISHFSLPRAVFNASSEENCNMIKSRLWAECRRRYGYGEAIRSKASGQALAAQTSVIEARRMTGMFITTQPASGMSAFTCVTYQVSVGFTEKRYSVACVAVAGLMASAGGHSFLFPDMHLRHWQNELAV